MGRHAAAYSLIPWSNGFWYFRLRGERSYRTTKSRDRAEALESVVRELLRKYPFEDVLKDLKGSEDYGAVFDIGHRLVKSAEGTEAPAARHSLRDYSADFFIWDRCPHCRKLRDEGRQITKRHAHSQRLWLEKYILMDRLADKPIEDLTRADILDFRGRISTKLKGKANSANKILAVLKTILKEAYFREDIPRDPTAGVGNLKETRKEAGIFTEEELRALFPAEGLGPWETILDKTCFLAAASTGMRRGEILALRWRHIDFKHSQIRIEEAWKSRDETGTPKWGRKRTIPLPEIAAEALTDFWERKPANLSGADVLVFCYLDGSRLGETWWGKHFAAAMKKSKIDTRGRGIKPHSFRHTVATLRRDAGEDPAKIRAALGWSNERTQEGYEHFTADMLHSEAMDRVWK